MRGQNCTILHMHATDAQTCSRYIRYNVIDMYTYTSLLIHLIQLSSGWLGGVAFVSRRNLVSFQQQAPAV